MNLHGIVSGVVAAINPTTIGNVALSAGFTTDASGKQTPAYTPFTGVPMQVQSLTYTDLQQTDSLNISAVKRAVYLFGKIDGLNRVDNKGGDLLIFPETPGGPYQTWLVVGVLEQWPDWAKVCAVLQDGS